MSTFLLLYTEPPTRRVFERVRPGRLILASDEITPEDRAVYDECIELPPIDDVEGTMRVLSRVRADRVVAETEYGLWPGALLEGRDPHAALLCTNKWLGRNALSRAGVPVPRFALVETAADVRRFARSYPVVLKSVCSTFGRWVRRVDSAEAVDETVAELRARITDEPFIRRCVEFARLACLDMGCAPHRQMLVEDYADGPTLETDGLVWDGQVECFGTTEQVVHPTRFHIEGYMFPADEGDLARATLEALGACWVRNGGFSVEFRGSTVIEVNGRLGEDEGFPDLFEAALGTAPILKCMTGDRAARVPGTRAAIAYRNGTDDWRPHEAWAVATHPTSSRAAYELARARLCGSSS